jgi:hypothetical protein
MNDDICLPFFLLFILWGQDYPIKCGNQCIVKEAQKLRKECNGKCLRKGTTSDMCNGKCDVDERPCGSNACAPKNETSVQECNGKCQSSYERCNGKCNQALPKKCKYKEHVFCALAEDDCKKAFFRTPKGKDKISF